METKLRGAGRPPRPSPKVEAKFRSIVATKGGVVVGEYAGSLAKVRLRCSHGHEWEVVPNSVANNDTWCPKCVNVARMEAAKIKFRSVVSEKGGEVLGDYTGTMNKVRLRCVHGHEWEATPNSVVSLGSWCPTCARQSPEVAETKFRAVVASKGGEVLGAYVRSKSKIRLRCRHGHEWEAWPPHIVSGHWCPTCYRDSRALTPILRRIEALQDATDIDLTPSRLRCDPAGQPAGSPR